MLGVSVLGVVARRRRTAALVRAPPSSMLGWPRSPAAMPRERPPSRLGWTEIAVAGARVSCSSLGWPRCQPTGARVWCGLSGDKITASEDNATHQGFKLQIICFMLYAVILIILHRHKLPIRFPNPPAAIPSVSILDEEGLWRRAAVSVHSRSWSIFRRRRDLALLSRELPPSWMGWTRGHHSVTRVWCSNEGCTMRQSAGARVWCGPSGDTMTTPGDDAQLVAEGERGVRDFTPLEIQMLKTMLYAGIVLALYCFKLLNLDDIWLAIKKESIKELFKNLMKLVPVFIGLFREP